MKVMGKKLKSMRAATTTETKIYGHHKFQVKRF